MRLILADLILYLAIGCAGLAAFGQLLQSPRSSGWGTPLMNADVIKMAQAGLPEQAIAVSIRSHPAAFDVSAQARAAFLRELQKPPAIAASQAWTDKENELWSAKVAKAAAGGGSPNGTGGTPGTTVGQGRQGLEA